MCILYSNYLTFGMSSPAYPPLIENDPISTTRAPTSSENKLYKNGNKFSIIIFS